MNIPTIPSLDADSKIDNNLKIMFIFIHIIFSMDFGYAEISNSRVKYAIKFLTVSQCLCFITIYYIDAIVAIKKMLRPFQRLVVVLLAISITTQYLANALTLVLINRDRSLFNLQKILKAIDSKLYIDSRSYKVEFKIILMFVICVTYKSVLNTVFCHINPDECLISSTSICEIFYLPMLVSLDIILLMYSFAFYSVYCRLKVFNRFVYNGDGTQVLESLDIYKSIANSLEVFKKYFDFLVSILKCLPTSAK